MSTPSQRAADMFEACHRAGAAQDFDSIATLTRELERLYALEDELTEGIEEPIGKDAKDVLYHECTGDFLGFRDAVAESAMRDPEYRAKRVREAIMRGIPDAEIEKVFRRYGPIPTTWLSDDSERHLMPKSRGKS